MTLAAPRKRPARWSFRMSEAETDAAVRAARRAGMSVSDFARAAIAAHVATVAQRARLTKGKKPPPLD